MKGLGIIMEDIVMRSTERELLWPIGNIEGVQTVSGAR